MRRLRDTVRTVVEPGAAVVDELPAPSFIVDAATASTEDVSPVREGPCPASISTPDMVVHAAPLAVVVGVDGDDDASVCERCSFVEMGRKRWRQRCVAGVGPARACRDDCIPAGSAGEAAGAPSLGPGSALGSSAECVCGAADRTGALGAACAILRRNCDSRTTSSSQS
jgi:hypothetical protein